MNYTNLVRKGIYVVKNENGIYKGMYLRPRTLPYIILTHVTMIKNGTKYKLSEALFDESEEFYDAEQYINEIKEKAQKAKQQMELRALDKILKRVVDENFNW